MPKSVGDRDTRIRFAAGEPILTLRIALHLPSLEAQEELYEFLASESDERPGSSPRLRNAVSRYVQQELGEAFTISRFIVGRGSVEVLIVIAAVVEIVANWDDLVRNVGRLLTRLRGYFSSRESRSLVPGPILVDADWQPEFDVGRVLLGRVWRTGEIPMILFLYLIATNLIFVGFLIWLVVVSR